MRKKKTRAETLAYTKQWWVSKKETEPTYEMFVSARKRARRKNLEFAIAQDDIVIPLVCPILDIELRQHKGTSKANSPCLDRIDNSKGYIKGNICVISNRANHNKSNMTIEQVENLLRYMKNGQDPQSP